MDHEAKFKFDNGDKIQDRLDRFEDRLYQSTTGKPKPKVK